MSPIHIRQKSVNDFAEAFRFIEEQAVVLEDKMNVNFEPRDIAVAIELWQKKADLMAELSACPELHNLDTNVIIRSEGINVRFQTVDDFTEWLSEQL